MTSYFFKKKCLTGHINSLDFVTHVGYAGRKTKRKWNYKVQIRNKLNQLLLTPV